MKTDSTTVYYDAANNSLESLPAMTMEILKIAIVIIAIGWLWLLCNHTTSTIFVTVAIVAGIPLIWTTLPYDDVLCMRAVIIFFGTISIVFAALLLTLLYGCYSLSTAGWTRWVFIGAVLAMNASKIYRRLRRKYDLILAAWSGGN